MLSKCVLHKACPEGSKGDARKGDGEKHPENTLNSLTMPENTLTLTFFLTFRVFCPIPFAGIPFGPFQMLKISFGARIAQIGFLVLGLLKMLKVVSKTSLVFKVNDCER